LRPYPPFFFPPPPLFKSSVLMIETLTGGKGKKYSAYALARKLVIARIVGRKVERLASSGMWNKAGTSGRVVRRRV
jgi:hypothetical protein